MGLTKTECYGSCPSYKVTIFSDGRAVFEASEDSPPEDIVSDEDFSDPVAVGRHEFGVSKGDAAALLAKFRAVDFFSLKDRYDNGTVDAPISILHFSDGEQSKEIRDNFGSKVGMPPAVGTLQTDVHQVSGASRLVSGEMGLVAILLAEKYDFQSPAVGRMLVRAIARGGNAETIKGLLDQGAPLRADWQGKSIGEWALQAAIHYGDTTSLGLLVNLGELKRLGPAARNEIAATVPICDLAKARKMKAVGLDPISAERSNGLAVLRAANDCSFKDSKEKRRILLYYLEQGANPNAANEDGETSLFGVWDVQSVQILLNHGADVSRRNKEGQSAVFSTWDEDVIVGLLEAGTKPIGRYFKSNFWEYVTAKKWTKVVTWLDAHPEMKAVAQAE